MRLPVHKNLDGILKLTPSNAFPVFRISHFRYKYDALNLLAEIE
jgi:hypothetical protein